MELEMAEVDWLDKVVDIVVIDDRDPQPERVIWLAVEEPSVEDS